MPLEFSDGANHMAQGHAHLRVWLQGTRGPRSLRDVPSTTDDGRMADGIAVCLKWDNHDWSATSHARRPNEENTNPQVAFMGRELMPSKTPNTRNSTALAVQRMSNSQLDVRNSGALAIFVSNVNGDACEGPPLSTYHVFDSWSSIHARSDASSCSN